ncbi:hypothetical protein ABID56_001023 [Alkalibacillus flavidus]|uniref:Uracil DNA glycosylase superfamily protein n=1 Tax=Alkalibacillus flavidus TaxID=546021 RepID=A0ABV2KTM0_9BACI
MNYNQLLHNAYVKRWESLTLSIQELEDIDRPTHPLLLKVMDEIGYHDSDIKLMVVGKETNDWEGPFGYYNVEGLQDFYETFMKESNKAKKTTFWRYMRGFRHHIEKAYPNLTVSTIWNNIHKLGRNGEKGKPNAKIQEITQKHFNVFEDELNILKPDIVIFLTGPGYDAALKNQLPGLTLNSIEDFEMKKIAHCSHPSLPNASIKTYHPGHLNTLTPEKKVFHRESPFHIVERMVSKIKN